MTGDETTGEPVRLALRGWEQRVQAVLEIGRDSDDLAARLPVLDALAQELVVDVQRAITGLDAATHHPHAELPHGSDTLRDALGKAHALLHDIELWHRPPSVGALRTARDCFRVAADRLRSRPDATSPRQVIDAREVLLTVRALLVDDQAVIVEVTRRVLEYRGIDVSAFTSSSEALAAFQHAPEAFDVAVVDRDMPGLDGAALATALWAVQPALAVLFVSAMDDAIDFGSTAPGQYRQLAKPYEADALVRAVLELGSPR